MTPEGPESWVPCPKCFRQMPEGQEMCDDCAGRTNNDTAKMVKEEKSQEAENFVRALQAKIEQEASLRLENKIETKPDDEDVENSEVNEHIGKTAGDLFALDDLPSDEMATVKPVVLEKKEPTVFEESNYTTTDTELSPEREMDDLESAFRAGCVNLRLKDWVKAAERFEKVLAIDPAHKKAAKYLAKCHKKMGLD